MVLDEQPVLARPAGAVVAHPHQHPSTVQPLAVELEPEAAAAEHFFCRPRPLWLPVASVPELHGATAVLPSGDRAFEVAVVERVILLDLDCEPPELGIERGLLGHGPGPEDSIDLEPQVVVQAPGCVLLDHEPHAVGWRDRKLATRLAGLGEVPFRAIARKLPDRHGLIL